MRIPVALIGLFLVRGFLYPRGWAGRTLPGALFAFIGAAMTLPLARYSRVGLVIAVVASVLALFPYRFLAVRFLKARMRSGLRALARRWGSTVEEEKMTGRWDVARQEDGRKAWVGNVLTHKGSLDPKIRRKEVGYMLALVSELEREPRFLCSLMIGWEKPRYFEREWRATHVIQGPVLSMPFGDLGLERDRGRATGGVLSRLTPNKGFEELEPLRCVALGTNWEEFARVFSGELLDKLSHVASQTYPYELNVTPTSLNIYTTYCAREVLMANVELLEELTRRLEAPR
ncbi:MAG TPA: hypothetical protein VLC48_05670 [Gemmatimonadota bacterium]|nr:hypothetical protein [Gemmatimonadota bacterium]